jgi:hypothetical protein
VGVDADRRRLVREGDHHSPPGVADLVEGLHHQVVDGPQIRRGPSGARLEAREVEQVPHQPVQPARLAQDGRHELAAICRFEREVLPGESACRGKDRHQRRAQVMAHRAEDGRLHRVAAAQRLGLERLAGKAFAVDGHAEQRGQGRQEAATGGCTALPGALEVERPHTAAGGGEWVALVSAAPHRPVRVAELDAGALHLQRPRSPLGDPVQLAADALSLEQRGRDTRKQRRLPRLPARACLQLADDDGRHEEDGEGEPVPRVRQCEGVDRREEEEVEREHARDRDRDRVGQAPEDRDRKDGEDVEHSQAEHRDVGVQERDRSGHCRDERRTREPAAQ